MSICGCREGCRSPLGDGMGASIGGRVEDVKSEVRRPRSEGQATQTGGAGNPKLEIRGQRRQRGRGLWAWASSQESKYCWIWRWLLPRAECIHFYMSNVLTVRLPGSLLAKLVDGGGGGGKAARRNDYGS